MVTGYLHLNFVLRIVKNKLVAAPRAKLFALDTRKRFLARQPPRRHQQGVVYPAGNDGPVRVAFHIFDDNFLPDTGNLDKSEIVTRPGVGNAHPAGGFFIVCALTIPMELHFHAAILVGEYFFVAGPGDPGRIAGLQPGFWELQGRNETVISGMAVTKEL